MTDRNEPTGRFELRIFFRTDSLASPEAARPMLDALIRAGGDLAPTRLRERHDREVPFSADAVERQFGRRGGPDALFFANDHGVDGEWRSFGSGNDPGSMLWLTIPFRLLGADGAPVVALAAAVCSVCAPSYGWGHAEEDVRLGSDPHRTNPFAPKQIYEAYWLMVLGAPLVRKLKRAHVAATPAHKVEFLPDGAALIVTSPSPVDLLSPAARQAQAAALAHLRPDRDRAQVLRELMERSAKLEPVVAGGDSDLAEVIRIIVEAAPLAERRATQLRLNAYRPPEVREWRPAAEALPADVDDLDAVVDDYHRQAQTFVAGYHAEIPDLLEAEPNSLPFIDAHFYLRDYTHTKDRATVEELMVPTLGAHLGTLLERGLDGRWVPRRNLDESQVIVGDRAWLPFLRVRHFVQSRQAALDYSLTRFYREAARHARGQG